MTETLIMTFNGKIKIKLPSQAWKGHADWGLPADKSWSSWVSPQDLSTHRTLSLWLVPIAFNSLEEEKIFSHEAAKKSIWEHINLLKLNSIWIFTQLVLSDEQTTVFKLLQPFSAIKGKNKSQYRNNFFKKLKGRGKAKCISFQHRLHQLHF